MATFQSMGNNRQFMPTFLQQHVVMAQFLVPTKPPDNGAYPVTAQSLAPTKPPDNGGNSLYVEIT